MKFGSFIRPFIGLFAALFVWVQAGSISHATTYADTPHEHEGAVCVLATLVTDTVTIPLVEIEDGLREHPVVPTIFTSYTPVFHGTRHGRAPPPRGPPLTF